MQNKINEFFSAPAFGVVGASNNRDKYGNKVLRCYLQHQKTVYPINPNADEVEGVKCLQSINDLPKEVTSISIITPPNITEQAVDQALSKGIKNIWMQPGAESAAAIKRCQEAGANVIAGGPCILVELGCF